MIFLRKIFVNYAPIFLLAPFSLAVGLYVFRNAEVLSREENLPFYYFYIFFSLAPLYFVLFRSRQDLGNEVLEIKEKFVERFSRHKWIYLAIAAGFSIFFLYIASIHISTYYERDQWILENALPILPIDLVLTHRLALVLSWIVPIDIAIPLLNLFFILAWFAFLLYVNAGEGNSWVVLFLVFISTFFTGTLYLTQYATFELPTALLSFIGLYGIWRRKFGIGLLLLIIGGALKNTGIFHVATGGLLLLFVLYQDGLLKETFKKLDVSLLVFLGIYFILNHWGVYYYIFAFQNGPEYIVSVNTNQIFWLSSFLTFIKYLGLGYSVVFIFGLLGACMVKKIRLFALFSVGLLMFLRCFSKLADGGYASIFVAGLSFFSIFGIAYVLNMLIQQRSRNFFILLLIGFNVYSLYTILSHFPSGMNRLNSNFDEFIEKIAKDFPRDGRIYQRQISLIPYLREHGRSSVDDIEFDLYPEIKEPVLVSLSEPGCRLIVMPHGELGITEEELLELGYSQDPFRLVDHSGLWVAYSRSCTNE